MRQIISLHGKWAFCLDADKKGLDAHFENMDFSDTITLPTTVSEAHKGALNSRREEGCLTDPYFFEGYTWYRREVSLPYAQVEDLAAHRFLFSMERPRISYVWVDGVFVGCKDSFVDRHTYDLTPFIHNLHPELVVMISNTDYKVAGGHMTSPDTQTNWNGILGECSLSCLDLIGIEEVHAEALITGAFTGASTGSATGTSTGASAAAALCIGINNFGADTCTATLQISAHLRQLKAPLLAYDADFSEVDASALQTPAAPTSSKEVDAFVDILPEVLPLITQEITILPGENSFPLLYDLSDHAFFWSEEHPYLYEFHVELVSFDQKNIWFGLKSFLADGDHFSINGHPTFLRGKHDGMIFPLTGYAPMHVSGWLSVMKRAKDLGINHYRFHTCCPPEAAFLAADLLGIYMEPELPFWGTFNGPEDEGYNKDAQLFLRDEGFCMLAAFSNHPSYCMMSMGNELWGNPSAINDLLTVYKAFRPHVLFTQGSNNFQWVPNIQPMEDFFCGVRFTVDRQIRGSYAMCDQPLGHLQTAAPDTCFNYDQAISPAYQAKTGELSSDGTIEIQYGTGVKRVKLTDVEDELIAQIPIVSHEIGQYVTAPDFKEIAHYTGVLQPENLKIFYERLTAMHMEHKSEDFFRNSGALAVACYKNELEAAFRTQKMAGFQILDIQDFSGQGTALVGILNALMESKGLIAPKQWRNFCSPAVLQAEFASFIITAGQKFDCSLSLAYFREQPLCATNLICSLRRMHMHCSGEIVALQSIPVAAINQNGRHVLGTLSFAIPSSAVPGIYELHVALENTEIANDYTLWSYPGGEVENDTTSIPGNASTEDCGIGSGLENVALQVEDALKLAKTHPHILLLVDSKENGNSIEGTYCTDFWNYHMFKQISESMNKEIPIGTLGLSIDTEHPALADFPTNSYSTPQWYSIVSASRSTILDDTTIEPIVWTIDNFERNHRLGLLYEVYLEDLQSTVLVCTSHLPQLIREGHPEAAALYKSLLHYTNAPAQEAYRMTSEEFEKLFTCS